MFPSVACLSGRMVGSCLPLTHFLRIVRGIMLKGKGIAETAWHLWPISFSPPLSSRSAPECIARPWIDPAHIHFKTARLIGKPEVLI